MLSFSPLRQHLVSLFIKHYYKIESSKTVAVITHVWMGHISTTTGSNHVMRSLFGSQEGVLSPFPPESSAIPTPPSATPPPLQNPQTLQQFLSPLYVVGHVEDWGKCGLLFTVAHWHMWYLLRQISWWWALLNPICSESLMVFDCSGARWIVHYLVPPCVICHTHHHTSGTCAPATQTSSLILIHHAYQEKIHPLENGLKVLKMAF